MNSKVGVLGGGQLGRMLVEAANRLNIQVNILDAQNAPAKQISNHPGHIEGSFKDAAAIEKLAKTCDVVTVEIEHVDADVLAEISTSVKVEPSPKTLQIIKDKYAQKVHLQKFGIPTAESVEVTGTDEASQITELEAIGGKIGYPFMLKSKTEAYDGKGNYPVKSAEELKPAVNALGKGSRPLYAEKWANFTKELAVMVVKTKDGVLAYPTVETVHEDSICKLVFAPARVPEGIREKAEELARKTIAAFDGKGVFGVEMFLLDDGELLINEIAPRPHNSGHYTIEACPLSQYDAHLRAILDLPIPVESLKMREPAIMLNILGGQTPDSHIKVAEVALSNPRTSVHLYGKGEARKGRKMGHLTVTAPTMAEAEKHITPLIEAVDAQKGVETKSILSAPKGSPEVAVICGSDSDLPVLKAGFEILEKLQIPYYCGVVSAHRTPDRMVEFAKAAKSKGFKVIIAAAGGAAHLPGMTASDTSLPVIGVPVKASSLDGWDSVVSMTQMPRGTPVATVGVNNSTNAALLAARILGVSDAAIQQRVRDFAKNNEKEVLAKNARLEEIGPLAYLCKD
ncbi:phosphoribosylaminoimidazole carboxylase [Pseudovirgaria hyperparasitica]|uniref:Phosphoribosylaminoimidazole carboxylase n=1 Tax=Pseudovirgaria hyperparasitica TaxID=470096 RepID=A0A6A6VUI4_9PEZI|nr:phosphoribosylaminoimidazole carboxylase [Pseudovirgaria hyperparasitica]KAF2753815.1 phosphoribosylaminoimidazole carboxylase [Pseudovirgaria hyperparasitica]